MGKPRSSYTADRKPAPLPAVASFAAPPFQTAPPGDVELSYVKFKHAVPMAWSEHLAEVYAGALCGGRIYVRGQLVHILRGSAETVVPVGDMMTGEVKR